MRPGLFCFPRHRDLIPEITRLQPSVVKAFASVTSNDWWKRVKEVSPGSIRVLVHGEISDNPDLSNPEADAEATARYLSDKPDVPRLVILKNEPSIWDGAEKRATVRDYTVRWLHKAHALGLNGVVGEFNSGWPRVSVLDAEDWWPGFDSIDVEMNAGDYWGLHEYWGKAGPLAWWPWTCGRHLRCPTTHNILIDECGFDGNTDGLGFNQGWLGVLDKPTYVSQIVDFHRMVNSDPRVKGTAIFLMDYDNNHWNAFDTWPLAEELIAEVSRTNIPHPATIMPSRLVRPVNSDRVTADYAWHKANNKLGGWGIDFGVITGTPVMAAADGTVDRVEDQGATGYGKWIQVNHNWGFSRYAHLGVQKVAKGDVVTAGQVIGWSGNTGNSSGAHLHFELLPFTARAWPYRIDPAPYILGGAVVPETPTPTPATPSPEPAVVTPTELAYMRAQLGSLPATMKACDERGYEWRKEANLATEPYVYAIAWDKASKRYMGLKIERNYWKVVAETAL